MTSKKIQGITIQINGDTTKLNEALKDTNKVIYSTNSELKNLNAALKLDPKNTELLTQKQELLRKNIQESTNKLNTLKEAQRQLGNYNSLTEEQKENYRALSVEIAKSENAIKGFNSELRESKSIDLSALGSNLKNIGNIAIEVTKKIAQVVATVSAALAGIVGAGVKSYASLEQNLGGIETLFGDDAQKVIDNANKAYETAGVSANEYMEGVTSFSASLLQALGNDTAKAADVADMAFIDMADNANKFGTDMSSIQNAYQGFAKQNYTMLDNLKLGYGGTKTEMERLLADAQKISGVKYDISNLSDVYNAIHVIQNEMGVTGTTAVEASKTLSGSFTSMKASISNFLNGSGSPSDVSKSIETALKNAAEAVKKLAPGILQGIIEIINNLVPTISSILLENLPLLFETAQNLISSLFQMISENVDPLINLVLTILNNFVTFVIENLPMIINTGIQILLSLIQGITDSIPNLIPAIVNVILDIVDIILNNLNQIIQAGVQILLSLIDGIMNALPDLIARLPEIIITIVMTLISLLPQIMAIGPQIIISLAQGIINGIPELIKKIPEIITGIVNALKGGISQIKDVGIDMVKGLWNGIKSVKDWVLDKIKGFGESILGGIKDFFGIHSPSTLFEDEIGVNLAAGIGVGFSKEMKAVRTTMENAIPVLSTSLNVKGESSGNRSINNVSNNEVNNFNFYDVENSPSEYARVIINEKQFAKLASLA